MLRVSSLNGVDFSNGHILGEDNALVTNPNGNENLLVPLPLLELLHLGLFPLHICTSTSTPSHISPLNLGGGSSHIRDLVW